MGVSISEAFGAATVLPNIVTGINRDANEIVTDHKIYKAQQKKDKLLITIDSILDKPFLKTDIVKDDKDGNFYLKILPDTKDPSFKNISIDFLNRKLGLNTDVIKNEKDNNFNDDGTLKNDSPIYVPLEEIGQKTYIINGGDNKALKKAIRKFNKLSCYLNY